jgi:hypothetical protein
MWVAGKVRRLVDPYTKCFSPSQPLGATQDNSTIDREDASLFVHQDCFPSVKIKSQQLPAALVENKLYVSSSNNKGSNASAQLSDEHQNDWGLARCANVSYCQLILSQLGVFAIQFATVANKYH